MNGLALKRVGSGNITPVSMKNDLAIFEGHGIRRIFYEKAGTWFFSVVNIIQVLTHWPDYQTARKYWNELKARLWKESSK